MFRPTLFGKYLLTHRLAVGGMAEIYKAKVYGVGGFEKDLVVKQILPQYARYREFVEMFIDEAKITVSLNHGNIVPVYELGRIEGIYFIAMEYVHGRDLSQVLLQARQQGRPMDPELAVAIAIDVLRGLDYAHRRKDADGRPMGIVHRDVSPQNVMVSFDGEVKLLDFGIAKAAQKLSRTHPGVVRGKFAYLAPEMARGESVDRRSDIFSAGVLLWEVLTGQRLFTGESEAEVLRSIDQAAVDPPSRVRPAVPGALDPLVLKALARDPGDRYRDAASFQLALSKFLYTSGGAVTSESIGHYMRALFADQIAEEREAEADPTHQARIQRLYDELAARMQTTGTGEGGRRRRPLRRPRQATVPGVGGAARVPTRPLVPALEAVEASSELREGTSPSLQAGAEATGRVSTGRVSTGQVSTGQVSTGRVSTGQVSTGRVSTGPVDFGVELDKLLTDLGPLPDAPSQPGMLATVEQEAESAALDYEVFASRGETLSSVSPRRSQPAIAWIAVTLLLLALVGWLVLRTRGGGGTAAPGAGVRCPTADVTVRVHPETVLGRDGRRQTTRLYWYQGDTPLAVRDLPAGETNELRVELPGYSAMRVEVPPGAWRARGGAQPGGRNGWERRVQLSLRPGSRPLGVRRLGPPLDGGGDARRPPDGGGDVRRPRPGETGRLLIDSRPAGAAVWLYVGTGFRGEQLDPCRSHRFLAILPARGRRVLTIRPFKSPDRPGDWTVLPGSGSGVRFRGEIDFDEEE